MRITHMDIEMSKTFLPFGLGLTLVLSLTITPVCLAATTKNETHAPKDQGYVMLDTRQVRLNAPGTSSLNLNDLPAKAQFSYNERDSQHSFYDQHGIDTGKMQSYAPIVYKMRTAAAEGAGLGLVIGEIVAGVAGGHHSFAKSAMLGAASAAALSGASSFFEQSP